MNKIAVLGANGYIGRYLVENLTTDGYEVLPVTRSELTLTNTQQVKNWLEKYRPYAIINCASSVSITGVREHNVNFDDLQNNINIFLNFYYHSDLFSKFINIGTGAEFDKTRSITEITETELTKSFPTETYGYSKNLISRFVLEKEKFYTLRLFGCFDKSEPTARLFQQLQIKDQVTIEDKQFDYISARDFYKVLNHYLNNNVEHKDINCVYSKKYMLSEIANMFKEYHNLPVDIVISGIGKNYSACGKKLSQLAIALDGLEKSIKSYNANSLI